MRECKAGLITISLLLVASCGGATWTLPQATAFYESVGAGTSELPVSHPAVPSDLFSGERPRWELSECDTAVNSSVRVGEWCASRVDAPSVTSETPDGFSFLTWSCDEVYSYAADGALLARNVLSHRMLALRAEGRLAVVGRPAPRLGIALGDQVYVDPHPKENGPNDESLAAFGGPRSRRWRLAESDAPAFFSSLYAAHFLQPVMNRTLSAIPVAMMWDDHEIRDGWGSQFDEDDARWRTWYAEARRSFVGWQALRNPRPVSPDDITQDRPMTTQFRAGERTRFMLMDLRSERDAGRDSLISATQLAEVRRWLADQRAPSDECGSPKVWFLGSTVPLFVRSSALRNFPGLTFRPELRDDLLDSWGHPERAPGRARLLSVLREHFARCTNDQLVVLSGDIHESGLLQLNLDGRRVGWEVVSSGLAADSFGNEGVMHWGWRNLTNPVETWTSDHAGRVAGSPSFAEVFISGLNTEAPPTLDVAWWLSVDRQADDDDARLNVLPAVCEATCARHNDSVPTSLRTGSRRATSVEEVCGPESIRSDGDLLLESLSNPADNLIGEYSCLSYSAAKHRSDVPATAPVADWTDEEFCQAVCR